MISDVKKMQAKVMDAGKAGGRQGGRERARLGWGIPRKGKRRERKKRED